MFVGIFLLATILLPLSTASIRFGPPPPSRCETVIEPRCRNFYNRTLFPNSLLHYTQSEASKIFSHYEPLLNASCSTSLLLLLCSRYYPLCTQYNDTLPPCRELCECAKRGCEPLLISHKKSWPADLDCDKFPSNQLCVHENASCTTKTISRVTTETPSTTTTTTKMTTTMTPEEKSSQNAIILTQITAKRDYQCKAPLFASRRKMDTFAGIEFCKSPCNGPYSDGQLASASKCLIALSILCLICVLFSIPARFVEKPRFSGPENPVLYLNVCLMIVSVGYIVGANLSRNDSACDEIAPDHTTIRTGDQFKNSTGCIFTFLMTYFFSMASMLWWLVSCLNWFLACAMQWKSEEVSNVKILSHFFVWSVCFILVATAFAMSAVEGDVLANVCTPGSANKTFLAGFVILPTLLILLLGIVLLVSGIIKLYIQKRKVSESETRNDPKKLFLPSLFAISFLIAIAYTALVTCYFSEQAERSNWQMNFLDCSLQKTCSEQSRLFFLAMFKYSVILVPGIIVPFWAYAGKFKLIVRYYWTPKKCASAACQPVEQISVTRV